MNNQQNLDPQNHAKLLAEKMRRGSGVGNLLNSQTSSTHYLDSLQRFQKDYAGYERIRRQQQKMRKQAEIQAKRLKYLERQNKRWEIAEQKFMKKKQWEQTKIQQQILGIRKSANTNSLAYNPINLSYDKNQEGQKLKIKDEDVKIRGFVRAHNMDYRGDSKYNPLNGGDRISIESVIPSQLTDRYQHKLKEHYDSMKLQAPSSNNEQPKTYY